MDGKDMLTYEDKKEKKMSISAFKEPAIWREGMYNKYSVKRMLK